VSLIRSCFACTCVNGASSGRQDVCRSAISDGQINTPVLTSRRGAGDGSTFKRGWGLDQTKRIVKQSSVTYTNVIEPVNFSLLVPPVDEDGVLFNSKGN